MALVSRLQPQRVDIPHEPNEWIEILPISAGGLSALQQGADGKTPVGLMIEMLAQCIKAWSYPVPVSIETLSDLDGATLTWLQTEVNIASGVRSDAEKNSPDNPSLLITSLPSQESNGSLANSGT